MKHLMKMTIPAVAIILLSACGGNEPKVENHEGHDHASTEQKTPELTAKLIIKDDNLNAVYSHYSQLTIALTNDNAGEAKIVAAEIEAAAKKIDEGAPIIASASSIAATSDIEAQRTAYSKMSDDLIAFVKKAGIESGELYLTHCPMAFDNKGASWISSGKEIRNPFFGEKMLKCGEIKETIN